MRIPSYGLLSKYGFGDGDMFESWLIEHSPDGIVTVTNQAMLLAAVRAYLLPALRQQVEVFEYVTTHNPIRAERVDGVEIDDCDSGGRDLEPEYVEVTDEQLVALFPGKLIMAR